MNNNLLSTEVVRIKSPEDLRACTPGSDVEIVQLKPGRLQGSLTHIGIGNLEMSLGRFSLEIRARGLISEDKVTIGMLLESAGHVSHWWQDVQPSDLVVFPPGVDDDAIYGGGASYAAVSMAPSDLMSVLGDEDHLTDPAFWNVRSVRHTEPILGEKVRRQLTGMISNFERKAAVASIQAADFLRRSLIEVFLTSFISASSPGESPSRYTGARLVSEAENYLDAAGGRPIHVSEL